MDGIGLHLQSPDALQELASKLPGQASAADSGTAARRFQELLGALLVKEMRGTLPEGFFGEGAVGDVYGGWLDQHVGAALAQRDALHLEDIVRESLDRKARQQEVQS
jgi:Rod binding domain-containing protein